MSAFGRTLVEWAEAATVHGVQYVFTAGQVLTVLVNLKKIRASSAYCLFLKLTFWSGKSYTVVLPNTPHLPFQHFLERLFWVLVCLAGIALATFFAVQVELFKSLSSTRI